MAELLEIEALGGLRIRRGGTLVTDLGSRKAAALLVYLVCSRRPQPREVLADLLWDERSTAQATANLRVLLTRLGKQLSSYLLITRSTVAFNLESSHWFDVAEMEQLLASARSQRTHGDGLSPIAAHDLEQATALYSGPFMQGFYLRESTNFEDWMLREQDRLQRLNAAALHDLVAYYLERGEHSTGIEHAAHLLQLDHLNEDTHRQLMHLLVLSGQRRAALEQYETCRRVLKSELRTEPGTAITQLYESIRSGEHSRSGSDHVDPHRQIRPPHRQVRTQHLPHLLTPFVGRVAELAELAGYLADPQCPLVTLVGLGGSGKTRMAIQAAQMSDGFLDGVFFVPLASLGDPMLLTQAIADVLQFTFAGPTEVKAQLFNYLQDKELLLVLDNFEQLLAGANILTEMLQAAPRVKLLVTSREPLNLSAEQIFDLRGLAVPPNQGREAVEKYDAVELFVQRARKAQSRFTLTSEVTSWVVRICQLVEGLPLGIEFAAAQVRERTCREIAQELEHNLDLLETAQRDVPTRHRSLRAVFDQMWNRLTEDERKLMRHVSVFRGGFDAEAARVMGADRVLLGRLAQQSLLRLSPGGRYDLHELLRQFALQKLDEVPGEREEAEARHGAYFVYLAETSFSEMVGVRQVEWSNRLEHEHDNLRAALSRAFDRRDAESVLRISVGLQRFWYFRAYLGEGRHWLEAGLSISDNQILIADIESEDESKQRRAKSRLLLSARAMNGAAMLAREQGDRSGVVKLLEECVMLLRIVGETKLMGGVLNNLALHARDEGDLARAEHLSREALELYREQDDKQGYALALGGLGKIVLWSGDTARAKLLLEESLAEFHELGETRGIALELTNLGQVAREEGDYQKAAAFFTEGLARYREVGDRRGITDCLEGLAIAHAQQSCCTEDAERVVTLYGAATALRSTTGADLSDFDRTSLERMIEITHAQLDGQAWATAFSKGRAMSMEQAVAIALDMRLSSPVGSPCSSPA
jgi:predicted ATPase/DNA-binding SARP family transcriptional activator